MYNLCRVSKNCYNSCAYYHERLGKLTELWVLIILWCSCSCLFITVLLPLLMILWELELKHNLVTQVLNAKTWSTKSAYHSSIVSAFWAFIRPYYICWVRHVLTLAIFTPQTLEKLVWRLIELRRSSQKTDRSARRMYPQSVIPCEVGARRKY